MGDGIKHKFGYARVSDKDQDMKRQIAALKVAGIEPQNIFTDMQSEKDFDRPIYKKLVKKLQKQDELYVKSLDRLGRNHDEILEQWHYLTKVNIHNCYRLPLAGHPTIRGRHYRRIYCGSCAADPILCHAGGTRKRTPAAVGGNKRG